MRGEHLAKPPQPACPLLFSSVELESEGELSGVLATWLSVNFDEDAILLGTADDGQLWGRYRRGRLVMARDVTGVGADLRRGTLQSLRVFTSSQELRVWRRGKELCAKAVCEGKDPEDRLATLECEYPLIGSHQGNGRVEVCRDAEDPSVQFSILEGRAGERHAPPVAWRGGDDWPRLSVRHYYRLNEHGVWRLHASRWLDVNTRKGG